MEKKSKTGLFILIFVVLIAIIVAEISIWFNHDSRSGAEENDAQTIVAPVKSKKSDKAYIAIVNITGVIQAKGTEYNQHWLLTTIENLKKDKNNKGILLFIDSPGGTVYQSDEAYLALLEYKASGKKVYAYFASMAASGGYYIGCSADKIFANRNCLTGSIGVISASTIDATEFLEKLGIKSTTIHAGKNKNMLNYNEPLSDEQRQIMQTLADEAYEQFTNIVAESRNMNIEVVKGLADGRIYSANQAKDNGLIDEVMTLSDTEDWIRNDLSLFNLNFKSYRYNKPDSLKSMLFEGLSLIENPAAAWSGNGLSYLYTGR